MKSRLIVNPVSGTDSGPDYLQAMNERLRERFGEMDIVMTVGSGDAARAAEEAAQAGCEQLFVAGGDGTLNEALNGVAGVDGALERITFGLVPLGTGNDFAAALGLPEEIEAALDILSEGRVIEVDVGSLNERRFVNVSAGGFIAEVSDAVDPQLKSIAGKLAYLVGGAQVLLDYEPVRARLRVVEDGEMSERELDVQMFAVCNSRLVGGGRMIAPHAVIDDALLDVCIIEAMPTLEFISLLTRVSGGDHIEDERVHYFQVRELELDFSRVIKVNTDGEVLETDRCRYSINPRAARFLAGAAPFAGEGEAEDDEQQATDI
ncbi:MAG: diacylglycerol kinase family lipid kinase [Acidobacteriota bacterium]|nr:diacylglycerol kinase family lipid kinase [Acidobacteriota bacterium]